MNRLVQCAEGVGRLKKSLSHCLYFAKKGSQARNWFCHSFNYVAASVDTCSGVKIWRHISNSLLNLSMVLSHRGTFLPLTGHYLTNLNVELYQLIGRSICENCPFIFWNWLSRNSAHEIMCSDNMMDRNI